MVAYPYYYMGYGLYQHVIYLCSHATFLCQQASYYYIDLQQNLSGS